MERIGLTGSIGMGKSTTAALLRHLRVPVFDADAVVHELTGPGGAAVPAIAAIFPSAVRDGAVDRQVLGGIVFADRAALRRLEGVLHPLVGRARGRFLRRHRRARRRSVVFDVPLLFETGGEKRCDRVFVVSAPFFLQRQRVLARPGMSVEKFRAILAKQTPDHEKRRRADIVLPTGLGRAYTFRCLRRALRKGKRHGP
ncbi:MAG: dephospho-CoA kinase [Pseudomonadota bacterium]|nr:dephospho-CoA kinase [Pseudomonadota bacterium]